VGIFTNMVTCICIRTLGLSYNINAKCEKCDNIQIIYCNCNKTLNACYNINAKCTNCHRIFHDCSDLMNQLIDHGKLICTICNKKL